MSIDDAYTVERVLAQGKSGMTEIVTIEEVLGMTLVSAKVTAGEETIAEAEIKIALSDKESKGEE